MSSQMERYLGQGPSFPSTGASVSVHSGWARLPVHQYVHQPGSSPTDSHHVSVLSRFHSISRHECLNHWLLMIELNLQSLSLSGQWGRD